MQPHIVRQDLKHWARAGPEGGQLSGHSLAQF